MKKESRRVKITKKLLNESLLRFMAQKPFPRITVKEICEDADVNRSTYYAHFSDPYEQLKTLETDVLADMAAYAEAAAGKGPHTGSRQIVFIRALLEYIKSNQRTFDILMKKNADLDFQKKFLIFWGRQLQLDKLSYEAAEISARYEFIYVCMGCFGMIHQWIIDDMEIDAENMAKMMSSFLPPPQPEKHTAGTLSDSPL